MSNNREARHLEDSREVSHILPVTQKTAEEILRGRIESHKRRFLVRKEPNTNFIYTNNPWLKGHTVMGTDAYAFTIRVLHQYGYDDGVYSEQAEAMLPDAKTIRTTTVHPSGLVNGLSFTKFSDRATDGKDIATTIQVDFRTTLPARGLPQVA